MPKLILATAFIFTALGSAHAVDYTTYRDLHQETQYGSLFFNEGAIRYRDNRRLKRFNRIVADGHIDLPKQGGYCFVFNHYDSPGGNDVPRIYRAVITKSFSDGRQTEEPFEGRFTPTSSVVSPDLPDLCISGTNNVTTVSVVFSSDDGTNFDWRISFDLN